VEGTMDPVRVDFQRGYEVDRWRVIGNIFLAIPHIIILYFLQIVRNALTIVAFFTVLFTKEIPEGIFNVIVMTYRYQWRVSTFTVFMRNEYPKFEFETTAADPGTDLAFLSIERQDEYDRWKPLYKWILAIPHFIVLFFYALGAAFVVIAAWFVVLFTGKWPDSMRDYVVKVNRYATRVTAYAFLLRDEYPAFGLT
jgi:hypothetical protein